METNEKVSSNPGSGHRLRKRWAVGAAVLCTAALFGAAAASANASTPLPSGSPSVSASHHPTKVKTHKAGHALRAELLTVIKNGKNAGDLATVGAIALVDSYPKFEAKLPAALQSDLKTLADAPASQRAADAAKLKTDALGGAYGTRIQKEAQNIQNRLAAHAVKVK